MNDELKKIWEEAKHTMNKKQLKLMHDLEQAVWNQCTDKVKTYREVKEGNV